MNRRILIVGSTPYMENSPSRALDTFFHFFERDYLAQIYTTNDLPNLNYCAKYYQITDIELLKNIILKTDPGKEYSSQQEIVFKKRKEVDSKLIKKLYSIGRKGTPIIKLLRKILWDENLWNTKKFNKWLDDFKPECIFFSFSNDFYQFYICNYISQKYSIPIVSFISDDYYFVNMKKTIFSKIYENKYKAEVNNILNNKKNGIVYISKKIKDKYDEVFKISSEVIYLSTNVSRKEFKQIDRNNIKICYVGNISLGRNITLNKISEAFHKIDERYIIDVYSNEKDRKVINKLNSYIRYNGSISYEESIKKIKESDIILYVESFDSKYVEKTKYSLSTKTADYLASGTNIFACGSSESGAIDYMRKNNLCEVCFDEDTIYDKIFELIDNKRNQYMYYSNAKQIVDKNHNLITNYRKFSTYINELIGG